MSAMSSAERKSMLVKGTPSTTYNGLRLNFRDLNVKVVNGLSLGVLTASESANGISLGPVLAGNGKVNGINIGGLVSSGDCNGVSVTGLWSHADKINGVALAGLNTGNYLNGWMIGYWGIHGEKKIQGVAIATFFVQAQEMNGLAVSILNNTLSVQRGLAISLFNRTRELHGVQIGLLNYAGNNLLPFLLMPLINLHL